MLGKTVIDESHPQFIGLYMGDRSRQYIQDRVNSADCILEVGLVMSDLNTGGFTMKINSKREIRVENERTRIKNHWYNQVSMGDFLTGLAAKITPRDAATLDIHKATDGCAHRRTSEFVAEPEKAITAQRFFDRIAHFIPENAIVIAETGVSMFGVAEVLMPKNAMFVAQVFYGSIGYTVGATLGVAIAARDRPVILFVGDGSFQVTAQDLSTMIRYKTTPTIFLINNDGYTIERLIIDGPYNDIQPWKYHKLLEVFGAKSGGSFDVEKEGALEDAIKQLEGRRDQLNFIEVHMGRMDCTDSLKSAGKAMAAQSL